MLGMTPGPGPGVDRLRLGRWGEQLVSMLLTGAGYDVYAPTVDDRAIDLLVRIHRESIPAAFVELQVKTVRLAKPSYVFMRKRLFPLQASRYLALVVLKENSDPGVYFVPSLAWMEPKSPFSSRDYEFRKSEPEFGISVSQSNLIHLEQYRFDQSRPFGMFARDAGANGREALVELDR